jgi:hypothetical protein
VHPEGHVVQGKPKEVSGTLGAPSASLRARCWITERGGESVIT